VNLNYETTSPIPASISANVPKLSGAARLVELSISVWSGRKQDKAATQSAADANGTDKDMLNTTKKLLGDCPELEAVRKFAANTRYYVYGCTTPWGDLGQRMLSMKTFPKFHKEMTGLETEFWRLVNDFLSTYDFAKSKAQAKLGALFNPDEYPTSDSLREKFRFICVYAPMPETGDIRVDVANEAEVFLQSEYAKHFQQRYDSAMKDVWDRVYDSLKHMAERIDYQGKDDKKKFHNTLVDNVREVADLLVHLNVGNDPRLTTLHAQLDQALMGVTPDALREDDEFRIETKKKVDSVLKSMSW